MKFMNLLGCAALLSAGLPQIALAAPAGTPPVEALTARARALCTKPGLPIIKQVGNFRIHAVWFEKGNVENASPPNTTADRLFICLTASNAPLNQLDATMDIFTDGWITYHGAISHRPDNLVALPMPGGTTRYVAEPAMEWLWTRQFKNATHPCPHDITATGIHCGPRPKFKGQPGASTMTLHLLAKPKLGIPSAGWIETLALEPLPQP